MSFIRFAKLRCSDSQHESCSFPQGTSINVVNENNCGRCCIRWTWLAEDWDLVIPKAMLSKGWKPPKIAGIEWHERESGQLMVHWKRRASGHKSEGVCLLDYMDTVKPSTQSHTPDANTWYTLSQQKLPHLKGSQLPTPKRTLIVRLTFCMLICTSGKSSHG